MTEPEQDVDQTPDTESQDRPVKKPRYGDSPFDYPFVFPGLLLALGLWFGFDGWLNPACKSIGFNRIMSVIFGVFFVWTLITDIRVSKKLKERRARQSEMVGDSSTVEDQ
jgi:hypothetical protein